MEIVGLIVGLLGLVGTIAFGLRSKAVSDAFGKYVSLQRDIDRLKAGTADYAARIQELDGLKASIYHYRYEPKSRAFAPGDRVRLVKIPETGVSPEFGVWFC